LRLPELAPSPAVGVGHCDEKQALSSVGRAEVGSLEAGGCHRITEVAEPGCNHVQAPPNESSHVLDDDVTGAHEADDPEILEP